RCRSLPSIPTRRSSDLAAEGYVTTTKVSAGVTVQKIFTKAPKPKISGKPVVGTTLTAKVGTWSPKPTKFTYQWKIVGLGDQVPRSEEHTSELQSREKLD